MGIEESKVFYSKKKKKDGTVENGLEWEREQEAIP